MPRKRAVAASEGDNSDPPAASTSKKRARPAKKKSKAPARADEESSAIEDDDQEDGADATTKKGKAKKAAPSAEVQEKMAYNLARLALCQEFNRIPLKRELINKTVFEDYSRSSFNKVMADAQGILDSIGMELVEIRTKGTGVGITIDPAKATSKKKKKKKARGSDDDSNDSSEESAGGADVNHKFVPSKSYILRTTLDPKLIAAAVDVSDDEEEPVIDWAVGDQLVHMGILQVVLALIMANGRSIPDDEMRKHLRKLDVPASEEIPLNPAIAPSAAEKRARLEKLLDTWVKSGYLEKGPNPLYTANAPTGTQGNGRGRGRGRGRTSTQRADLDGLESATGAAHGDPAVEWRWGARSDAEIGEQNIGDFIETFFVDEEADQTRKDVQHNVFTGNLARAAGGPLQKATKA